MLSSEPGCPTTTRPRPHARRRGAESAAPTVAIVGGGFSGIMVAAHLLREARARASAVRVVVVEKSAGFEAGPAYRTCSPRHLLNVPAGRMSALPDDAGHFVRWLEQRGVSGAAATFVPRSFYREYLRAILDEARAAADQSTLEWIAEEALDADEVPGGAGLRVHLSGGAVLDASSVVLAVGNLPPANPPIGEENFYDSPYYVRDPWRGLPLEVEPDDPVLLIGTGLTMLDYALALDEQGHRGSIIAVSRRGLVPECHRPITTDPARAAEQHARIESWLQAAGVDRERSARGLVRAVRAVVMHAGEQGIDWRDVVGAIRGRTAALWQACTPVERARFLRHVRPYWEVARHRAAPAAAERFAVLRSSGRLTIVAAQLKQFLEDQWGVSVVLRARGSGQRMVVRAAKVINCTGPETRIERADHPLLRALVERRMVRPDPIGLGVETLEGGVAVCGDGEPCARLLVVGALNRGRLWESTAIEELRVQASATAARLAGRLLSPARRAAVAA